MSTTGTHDVDLFVVGAMKAATTGMCEWLGEQPGVTVSEPKEPSIFVSDDSVRAWLSHPDGHFDHGPPDTIRVDGSTDYAKFPSIAGVPERISRNCPQARFVYMVRQPVARLESQYRFEWMLGGDKLPIDKAITTNRQLVDNGRYAFQLRQWLDWFPPERFVLVFAEAFARDPAAQVRRILENFDGRVRDTVVAPMEARLNETALLVRRSRRSRQLRRTSVGKALRHLVPEASVDRYRRRLDARSRPDISDGTRRELESVFDEDLGDLRRLTSGPDLSCSTWADVSARWDPVLSSS